MPLRQRRSKEIVSCRDSDATSFHWADPVASATGVGNPSRSAIQVSLVGRLLCRQPMGFAFRANGIGCWAVVRRENLIACLAVYSALEGRTPRLLRRLGRLIR